MAKIQGTAEDDFMHRQGDGLVVPPQKNEIVGVTTGDDTLFGGAGNDVIHADRGDDTLHGGSGTNRMFGGEGDDRYVVTSGSDRIAELAGAGLDMVHASVDFTLAENVENMRLTGSGGISGTGNFLDNSLVGNDAGNLISGGFGADTLEGRGGDDTLRGGAGNDLLWGEAGNDTIYGGAGDDTLGGVLGENRLIGGDGADVYLVGSTQDTIVELLDEGIDLVKSRGDYTLGANLENLTLYGGDNLSGTGNEAKNILRGNAGNNVLRGLGGQDTLLGGAGDDRLDGGLGADAMAGGVGSDTYVVDNANDDIQEQVGGGAADQVEAQINSYTLGAELENLQFTGTGNFAGNGNTLDNRITGGDGDDTLNGLGGADTLIGGKGDDTYVVDAADEVVTEQTGEGEDLIRTRLKTYTLGADLENLLFTGAGNFTGTGNELANRITGGLGDDRLFGLAGADTLYGDDSDDTLDGGLGADFMSGDGADDTYVVDNANDIIQEASGGGSADTVLSRLNSYTLGAQLENLRFIGTGDFTGNGNTLDNRITSGDGNDTLNGMGGADTLIGGAGDDTYVVDNANEVVTEHTGEGEDLVRTRLNSYTLGANLDNLLFTGTSDFAGTGNALSNRITGGDGNDTLDGMGGTDTLIGGQGNDTYVVNSAGDVVTEQAGEGRDLIRTVLNSFTLDTNLESLLFVGSGNFSGTGNAQNNVITGGAGNDTLFGLAGADSLNGGSGNDILDGGVGVDRMSGGAGNDTYMVDDANDVIQELPGGGTADRVLAQVSSYTLGAEVERLASLFTGNFTGIGNTLDNVISGGIGNDRLFGRVGADSLYGGNGNDLLDGGVGTDLLTGGAGNDTYMIDDENDVVQEQAGEGAADRVLAQSDRYTLGAQVERLTSLFAGNFSGTGNGLDNVITGGIGNDTLFGLGGADSLYGGNGNDILDGGVGVDLMSGGAGNDTYMVDDANDVIQEQSGGGAADRVLAQVSSYTLGAEVERLASLFAGNFTGTGNSLDNVITGGTGNDSLSGLQGDDSLYGGTGNDRLDGGSGADLMAGGNGNDTYIVEDTTDVVQEAPGGGAKDLVLSQLNSYTLSAEVESLLFAGVGNFTGTGNAADNVIAGGNGNDTLAGGAGADTLYGRAGDDRILVGSGADVFVFSSANGADRLVGALSNDDRLAFDMTLLRIGDGDTNVEGFALAASGVNNWNSANEVVLVGGGGSLDLASVATLMSQSAGNVVAGRAQLFIVEGATDYGVYRHVSNGTRTVTAADLDLVFTVSSADLQNFNLQTGFVFVD